MSVLSWLASKGPSLAARSLPGWIMGTRNKNMGLFFSSRLGLEERLALAVALLLQLFPAANDTWVGIGD